MQHYLSLITTYIKLQPRRVALIICALILLCSTSVALYASQYPNKFLSFKTYLQAKYDLDENEFNSCVNKNNCYEFATTNITQDKLKVPVSYLTFESQIPDLRWLRTDVLGKYTAEQLHAELTEKNYEFGENSNPQDIQPTKIFTNNYSVTKDGKSGVISFIYYDDKVQYISVSQRYPSIGFTGLHNVFENYMRDPESNLGQPDVFIDKVDSPDSTKIYLRHGLAFVGQKELFIFQPTTEYNPEVMDQWLQNAK